MWTSCLLFLAVFEMYLLTHCASFNINDSGETILACARMTISHSPGYPLHMLWGRFNDLIFPFGQPMLRVTLASVWTASLSVVLFFHILKRVIGEALNAPTTGDIAAPRWVSEVAVLAGACLFACSYQQWFQAGGAKGGIYTLNICLSLAIVALFFRMAHRGKASHALFLVCFFFGLGLANHWPNIVVLAPVFLWLLFSIQTKLTAREIRNTAFSPTAIALFSSVFLLSSLVFWTGADPKPAQGNPLFDILMTVGKAFLLGMAPVALLLLSKIFDGVVLIRCASAALLGVTPYIALAVRSSQRPLVNWWNPDNWTRLWETVTRKGYSNIGDPRSVETLLRDLKRFGFAEHDQFGCVYSFLVFALALAGLVWLWRRRPALTAGFLGIACFVFASLVVFSSPPEGYQWTLDNFFTPIHLTIAFFAAMGLSGILAYLRSAWPDRSAAWVLASLTIILGVCPAFLNWARSDQSRYVSSYDYGLNMLKSVNRDGVILCNGDIDILPLWYMQYVEGKRPEVACLTMQLIPMDWYRGALFDQFPFLRVLVTGDIRPQTVVQNMIDQHASERSFYYTNIATAPWMPQWNLSASEGLLWRVADAKKTSEEFSVERINRLWSGYRLRSLDPPACGHWDEYTDVMKDSYGVGLTLLGPYCLVRGMPQQGIWSLRNALKYRSPQLQWPLHIMLSQFHLMLHDASSALEEAQTVLKLQPGNPYGFVRMGQAFLGLGNLEGARQSFDMALRIAPQFPEAQQGMSCVERLGRGGVSGISLQ